MSAVLAPYRYDHEAYNRREAEKHRDGLLRKLPNHLSRIVRQRWERTYKQKGHVEANKYITGLKETAMSIKFSLALDDEELISAAKRYARSCQLYLNQYPDLETALMHMVTVAQRAGVNAADPERHGVGGAALRMADEKWWRRALRKVHWRGLERLERALNAVNVNVGIYASDDTVNRRRQQKARNARILEGLIAVNEEGQEFSLKELSAVNVSNPAVRRAELMARIRGFEELADEWGYVPVFITWTAPSKMHRAKRVGGRENEKWDGSDPREVQGYFTDLWASARKYFDKEKIKPFGFRVVEPHHDGTPHWHFLIFIKPDQIDQVKHIMKREAYRVDPNEPGAHKHRFEFKEITRRADGSGGAAAYIAKYISKSIDGYKVSEDMYGFNAAESAERIEAWATTWGIRQFQQVGGPTVTVWRELRRLERELDNPTLEAAREAADRGDWKTYCKLNWNGEISLLLAEEGKTGQYGDTLNPILGVVYGDEHVISRPHEWAVLPSWLLEFMTPTAQSAAWSCVNNYHPTQNTQQNQEDIDMLTAVIEAKKAGEIRTFGVTQERSHEFDEFTLKAQRLLEMEAKILQKLRQNPFYRNWSDEEILEHYEFSPEGKEYATERMELMQAKAALAKSQKPHGGQRPCMN